MRPQVAHYTYYTSVADVWLLSFFRAGPGTWVLWTLREKRRAGKKELRRAHKKKHRQEQQQAKREGNEAAAAAEEEGDGGSSSGSGSGSGSPIRRQLTRAGAFMVFKTWLSFLAIFGKTSVFKAWDEPLPRGTLD